MSLQFVNVQSMVGYNTCAWLLYSTFTANRRYSDLYDVHYNYDNIFRRHLHLR